MVWLALPMAIGLLAAPAAPAQVDQTDPSAAKVTPPGEPADSFARNATPPAEPPRPKLPFEIPKYWLRLAKDHEVWLDTRNRQVVVGGEVCLRRGQLELFACPRLTKEHEAVVTVYTPARFVHAGLLALGVKEGTPVQFDPEYKPAQGTVIDVHVLMKDEQGKQCKVRAQQWVKQVRTGKTLQYDWVFVGSGFWTNDKTGQRYYYADGGDFICVSNFPSALLDLPVESSQANDQLMYGAFTEHIPPLHTRVLLLLKPRPTKPKKPDAAKPAPAPKKDAEKDRAKTVKEQQPPRDS